MKLTTIVAGAGSLLVCAAVYRKFLRQPILTWGATAQEATARLPGDELLEDADGVATRAITIDAPRWAVWPWIAQMGPAPRGGPPPAPHQRRSLGRRRGGTLLCCHPGGVRRRPAHPARS